MASAKNMKQLNALLERQLKKAMNEASRKVLSDMRDETVGFYADTKPKVYERTGALGETPRISDVKTNPTSTGAESSFKAYLDTEHQYTTGNRPSMETVLDLANRGAAAAREHNMREVVGNTGFWDRAEEKMEQSFDDTMKKYFDKI